MQNGFVRFSIRFFIILMLIGVSFVSGIAGSFIGLQLFQRGDIGNTQIGTTPERRILDERSAIIDVVNKSSDGVVSIIVTAELPNLQRYSSGETITRRVGAGSGFIVNKDGYIVTNRHVVNQDNADYSVVLNNGKSLAAKVLARDTVLDIAILKVESAELTSLSLGDSDSVKVGQRVIAIGNALGEFSNSVSEGIISGLGRSIIASEGNGATESVENTIQTDASINPGNSGGPLLDFDGNVIGVNVAVAANAENIGFAIPINEIKRVIDSVTKYGEIRRPYIGVRYVTVTEALAKANNLSVTYGALIAKGNQAGDIAVIAGGPADKAGLQENDIIIAINGEKLTGSLVRRIQEFEIGQQIDLKIMRGGNEQTIKVTLEQNK